MKKYLFTKNNTNKPVMWYVDLSGYEVEAMTADEATKKVIKMMKAELPEICNIELVDSQEIESEDIDLIDVEDERY